MGSTDTGEVTGEGCWEGGALLGWKTGTVAEVTDGMGSMKMYSGVVKRQTDCPIGG